MTATRLGRRSLIGAAASLALARLARADSLAAPNGKTILKLSGKIRNTNDGAAAKFDRALLESLGTASFTTTTPWHDHAVMFEGVPMTNLLQAVGATGDMLKCAAIDDYVGTVPVSDFAKYGTLLALKLDGKYMTVADKGPCFIIYPYDKFAEIRTSDFYSRAIWSVASIEVM